jgi:CO/xanthine dehydrogenase Mo-binding subunit
MANNQMTNYIMPTAEDVPPIHVYFEEIPFPLWRRTAPRASASCRTTAPRPRSLNAIRDATGVAFNRHSTSARRSLCSALPRREPVEEPALPV